MIPPIGSGRSCGCCYEVSIGWCSSVETSTDSEKMGLTNARQLWFARERWLQSLGGGRWHSRLALAWAYVALFLVRTSIPLVLSVCTQMRRNKVLPFFFFRVYLIFFFFN